MWPGEAKCVRVPSRKERRLNRLMSSRSDFARFDPTFIRENPLGSPPIIRMAVPEDLESMAAVNDASDRPFNDSSLEVAIRDGMRLVAVAVVDGDVVGWAKTHHFQSADDPAPAGHYLGGVTVAPDYRRGGVGSVLTEARLDWIWRRASEVWYTVNAANAASIRLHQRWGFREVARGNRFHSTVFDGVGVLFSAQRPVGYKKKRRVDDSGERGSSRSEAVPLQSLTQFRGSDALTDRHSGGPRRKF